MTGLLLAVTAALGMGLVGVLTTLRVARHSVRWATILSPVTAVLAIGAGLLVGIRQMLIGDAQVVLSVLAAVLPVALLVGIFVSIRSNRIASLTRAELEAEQRDRAVEKGRLELITWLSHDLRTPLAGIRAMGEALSDGVASEPERYYRSIIAEADRTTAMVNDLMALAGLQSGTNRMSDEPVSLADLVSDLLVQLQPLAEARGLHLAGELATDSSEVHGDASLLARALQNVMGNAVNYSLPGSRVRVLLYASPGTVTVRVSDGCGGLDEDTAQHMFEAGWRKDAARTPRATTGSGLGLSIVRAVVDAHGGRVYVEPGDAGCSMIIELPARASSPGCSDEHSRAGATDSPVAS
ncbi:sensor histidine kinase [Propionibacterium australiense]|uniref:histidine kinase n=1 Tax=Propionibacterium australiense TaxID=119981 RepID=A0A383S3H6_9ACTN|nr:HAMP domain-containing sensor histidine kinase [Propionibacterium australiense]RLP11679.1 sensor histidine kinase [Propionibacterium australiense]RLP12192.1 sensor histidine kinase [Propionibacterium australiense]SYZ32413.1 histidine kinase [Propionibacterium australiense]VEH90257.1 Sensor protein kinase walK [Propionibacterium australiense]